eukprot:5769243-Pyramimonas_sp.AAC.1
MCTSVSVPTRTTQPKLIDHRETQRPRRLRSETLILLSYPSMFALGSLPRFFHHAAASAGSCLRDRGSPG